MRTRTTAARLRAYQALAWERGEDYPEMQDIIDLEKPSQRDIPPETKRFVADLFAEKYGPPRR